MLLSEDHNVAGLDNFFRGKKENLPKHSKFTFFKCDLAHKNSNFELKLALASAKPEIVIHYAAINGTRYFYDIPYKVCNDNILMTQNVLKACKEENIKKVVYASSSEVYGLLLKSPLKKQRR